MKEVKQTNRPAIFFVHIPKTAGTSFFEMLSQTWFLQTRIENFSPLPENLIEMHDLVSGHLPYGALGSDIVHVTFLREPISRWISALAWALTRHHPIQKSFNKYSKIPDFLLWCLENDREANVMTKQLSGIEPKNNIIDEAGHIAYYWAPRKRKYSDEEMEKFLSAAQENLQKCAFIGFQEDSKRFHEAFLRQFNIHCEISTKKWTQSSRKTKKHINKLFQTNEAQELLRQINKYDIRLYDFARKNFWSTTA